MVAVAPSSLPPTYARRVRGVVKSSGSIRVAVSRSMAVAAMNAVITCPNAVNPAIAWPRVHAAPRGTGPRPLTSSTSAPDAKAKDRRKKTRR